MTLVAGFSLSAPQTLCDRLDDGSGFNPLAARNSECDFVALQPQFKALMGLSNNAEPLKQISSSEEAIFHEGPVIFEGEGQAGELYFVSNRLGNLTLGANGQQFDQYVKILKMDLATYKVTELHITPPIPMGNGMTKTGDRKNLLVLSQGYRKTPGGIYQVDIHTLKSKLVVNSYFGRGFNSPNDIQSFGSMIWFTDPIYGFEQGFREGKPELGNWVWSYDMRTSQLNLESSDFARPNGLALYDGSARNDGCSIFVSDSGGGLGNRGGNRLVRIHLGDTCGVVDTSDVFRQSSLVPLFPPSQNIQDGLRVFMDADVLFIADGSGVWVFSMVTSQVMGLIALPVAEAASGEAGGEGSPRGATQIAVSEGGDVYILAEKRLFKVTLDWEAYNGQFTHVPPSPPPPPGLTRRDVAALGLGATGFALGLIAIGLVAALYFCRRTTGHRVIDSESSKKALTMAPPSEREVDLTSVKSKI